MKGTLSHANSVYSPGGTPFIEKFPLSSVCIDLYFTAYYGTIAALAVLAGWKIRRPAEIVDSPPALHVSLASTQHEFSDVAEWTSSEDC